MPQRRRLAGLLAGLLLFGAVGAACSGEGGQSGAKPPKPYCDAAYDYEQELNKELTKGEKDAARQLTFVEKMAAKAPTKIRPDVDAFADLIRQVIAKPSLADDKSFQTRGQGIVDKINRYTSNGCGFFNQDPSQGI